MRNEQVLSNGKSAFFPALDRLCSDASASTAYHMSKDRNCCSIKGRKCPSHSAASSQSPASSRRFICANSTNPVCNIHWWESEDCNKEKSVLAQPVFVFEKKDRSCKRHAEDLVYKAENDCSGCPVKRVRSSSLTYSPSHSQSNTDAGDSQKRVRSSSFTFLPTFPPSQPVRKNNIFMPSTLLHPKTDSPIAAGTQLQSLKTVNNILWNTTQRNVIRPAILQPPHVQLCAKETVKLPENVVPTCQRKDTSNKSFTDNFCPLADNLSKLEKVVGQYNCTHISNSKPPRSRLAEDIVMKESTNSDFVFGENMVERVLSPQKSSEFQIESTQEKQESAFQMTFPPQKTSSTRKATLVESAAACASKSCPNFKMEKVDIITGEEAERNVLQINCKLFVLNKVTQSWIEKGRGSLRLNDTSSNGCGMLQSRLVMRNQGSLRLIFNTKLWAQMKIERANRKSLRITAADLEDNTVRVFLIQASAKDAGRLYAAIHHRLVALRISAEQEAGVNQAEAEPETGIALLNVDSDDEDNDEVTQFDSNRSDHPRWIRREPVMHL